jgi:hypothetical protein
MAEAELAVLSSQCLDRRIPDRQVLKEEVQAWEAVRNGKHAKADWHFTTANACVKLKRLYPALLTTWASSFPWQAVSDQPRRCFRR